MEDLIKAIVMASGPSQALSSLKRRPGIAEGGGDDDCAVNTGGCTGNLKGRGTASMQTHASEQNPY